MSLVKPDSEDVPDAFRPTYTIQSSRILASMSSGQAKKRDVPDAFRLTYTTQLSRILASMSSGQAKRDRRKKNELMESFNATQRKRLQDVIKAKMERGVKIPYAELLSLKLFERFRSDENRFKQLVRHELDEAQRQVALQQRRVEEIRRLQDKFATRVRSSRKPKRRRRMLLLKQLRSTKRKHWWIG